jgi:hypothetical protein
VICGHSTCGRRVLPPSDSLRVLIFRDPPLNSAREDLARPGDSLPNECVELHDSTLAAFRRDGHDVVVMLAPAYIHRSAGSPGYDEGTGWSVDVDVRIKNALGVPTQTRLPVDIADGTLTVGKERLVNGFPLPFASDEPVKLHLVLSSGEQLTLSGEGIVAKARGSYEYIEDFNP